MSTTPAPVTPVKGYRSLSAEELALMNEAKALGETIGAFVARLRAYPATPPSGVPLELAGRPSIDQRWVSIGVTDLQKGLMSVIRGIAQPTTF